EQLTITPVGMACHVGRDFSRFYSAIDPDLVDNTRVFDPQPTLSKGERIRAFILDTNHAMTFTGIDFDTETGEMCQLEIENSWGHYDSDEPLLDGFITMTRKAFEEDCTQVCVLTDILPDNLIRILGSTPEKLAPWCAMAEAMRIPGVPPNAMTRPMRITP